MVFKRRHKQSSLAHMRELIWPSMGWRRTTRYYYIRIMRLQEDPRRVCRGLATGVAISFIPLPGSHIAQAIVFAWLLRGNIMMSVVATFIGNPWTFPPMWFLAYRVGMGIFHELGWRTAHLPRHFSFDDLWTLLRTDPVHLLVPWLAGGYICAAIVWPATYFLTRPLVESIQKKHRERRHARQQRYLRETPQP